ncbi:UBX domain protein Ubx2, partial [Linderina pennispora]
PYGYARNSGGFGRHTQHSIFNQHRGGGGPVPFRDFAQEAAELADSDSDTEISPVAATSSRRDRLAELFKPPFDLMFVGDFQAARQESQSDGKWLLLNIQDVADFRCQALNRDVWKDELIKDIVAKNFVFLQIAVDTSEGGRLASLYNTQGEFPFIAIIDPKTGECQRVLSRFSRPNDFMDDVMSFLASSPAGAAGSSAAARAAGGTRSSIWPVHEMTEEEQLAAAIAASELETHHEGTQDDPIDIVDSDDDFESDDDGDDDDDFSEIHTISSSSYSLPDADDMEVEDTPPPPVRLSAPQPAVDLGPDAWYKTLPAIAPPEPPLGPTVTRIQFRLPNGSRVVRRFSKSDKVLVLFQYLKASVAEAQSEVPEVLFMRSRLVEATGQTIEEAKLVNASVTVDI